MPFERIRIGSYYFENFRNVGSSVVFDVFEIKGRDVNQKDTTVVSDLMSEIGQWESINIAGKLLLSELSLIQKDEMSVELLNDDFGIHKYRWDVEVNRGNACLVVSFSLTPEERRLRTSKNVHRPLLEIGEIYNQLKNIVKIEALKRGYNALNICLKSDNENTENPTEP